MIPISLPASLVVNMTSITSNLKRLRESGSPSPIKIQTKIVGQSATQTEYFVTATYNGRLAAKASVKIISKNRLRMAGIGVEEEFRRKGIATAIYNHMETMTGRTFTKGLKQTADGAALWASPKRTWGHTAK